MSFCATYITPRHWPSVFKHPYVHDTTTLSPCPLSAYRMKSVNLGRLSLARGCFPQGPLRTRPSGRRHRKSLGRWSYKQRSPWYHTIHGTIQYMVLYSTVYHTVHGTVHMVLYTVHGTIQDMVLYRTWYYTVQCTVQYMVFAYTWYIYYSIPGMHISHVHLTLVLICKYGHCELLSYTTIERAKLCTTASINDTVSHTLYIYGMHIERERAPYIELYIYIMYGICIIYGIYVIYLFICVYYF